MEQQSWRVDRTQQALTQAHARQGIALDAYVQQSIKDGTITREGFECALTEEMADVRMDRA